MTFLIRSLNLKSVIAAKAAISLFVTTQIPPLSVIPRFMRGIQITSWITRINRVMTNRWTPSLRGVQRRIHPEWATLRLWIAASLTLLAMTGMAYAATSIPFTIHTSEAVNVTGTPRIAVDVGGVTRYATYTSGSGTNALTFTYTMVAGDVDLDGVALSSPIDLNGGTIKDVNGNDATLTFTVPNTSNVKVNYPSLGMDFVADADGRYTLNGTVYNDLTSFLTAAGGTFTRASTATYFDSTGTLQTASSGTPRFDYDPVTHAAKGILIEENRSNLLKYSDQLDNIPNWNKGSGITITNNIATSPDGTISSEQIIASTGGLGYIKQSVASLTANTYTLSFYAKYVSGNGRIFLEDFQSANTDYFNIQSGATNVPSGSSYSITAIGNGWYRCVAIKTFSSAPSGSGAIYLGAYGTPPTTQEVYLWGAQLEVGAFPTSYIPTTSAPVTRNLEALNIPTGSWYNSSESTLFSDATLKQSAKDSFLAVLYESGTDYLATRFNTSSYIVPRRNDGSNGDMPSLGGTFTSNPSSKMAFYNGTVGASASRDGGSVLTSSSIISPSIGYLQLGGFNTSGGLSSVYIKKAKYYPARVSNTQLQLLTQ